jgi:hypothetical protein
VQQSRTNAPPSVFLGWYTLKPQPPLPIRRWYECDPWSTSHGGGLGRGHERDSAVARPLRDGSGRDCTTGCGLERVPSSEDSARGKPACPDSPQPRPARWCSPGGSGASHGRRAPRHARARRQREDGASLRPDAGRARARRPHWASSNIGISSSTRAAGPLSAGPQSPDYRARTTEPGLQSARSYRPRRSSESRFLLSTT